ncbi:MAG: hypothetical protein D6784_01330 [Chloroflexi bacterium]|nr:MAG: hypothetical protein D6784_01330 [Chloroflexota bacterium]
MRNTVLTLNDGAHVGIVGGGPAGSFFALHLLRYGRQTGRSFRVVIFENRDFSRPGPPGCARCAGLLSAGLQAGLRRLGLDLPPEVIQSRADSYVLHLADGAVEIFPPRDRSIISVYRSRGPRLHPLPREVNFDEWLLHHAEQAGASIVRRTVKKISLTPTPQIETRQERYTFDLVVLAAGVNGQRIQFENCGYRPPKTETMVQDELALLPGGRRRVQVFFGARPHITFGATVPKGNLVNLSLLGKGLNLQAVDEFLTDIGASAGVQRLCGCKPHIAVAPARGCYADRFVAVGDAAVTRLYKDGIGSAYRTARQAARTAVFQGIDRASFRRGYAPLCRQIALDNLFGRILYLAWHLTGRVKILTHLWLYALNDRQTNQWAANRCRRALWNMFTGDDSYRNIFFSLVDPRIAWFVLATGWRLWPQKLLRRKWSEWSQ